MPRDRVRNASLGKCDESGTSGDESGATIGHLANASTPGGCEPRRPHV